jgi:hypothetical protein
LMNTMLRKGSGCANDLSSPCRDLRPRVSSS